ncbi:hypothetical protein D3C81_198640 [compost metagenome]
MSNSKIDDIIKSNKKKLSVKEISDLTEIPRNTVQRYLDQIGYRYIPYKKKPWNKGLTKENNESVMNSATNRIGNTWNHTEESKQKISESRKGKIGVRNFGGTGNKYYYGDKPINSDFALDIVKILDKEKIKWNMDNRILSYHHNGDTRFISVDFYLEEYNIYITVKYHIQSDTRKKLQKAAKENNIKILIVDQMLYRRIVYTNLKDVLKNSLRNS